MAVIYITQEEAERDFSSLLRQLDANTSFVIEKDHRTVAKIEALPLRRTAAESLALLPESSAGFIDDRFEADVLAGIEMHRDPTDLSIFEA